MNDNIVVFRTDRIGEVLLSTCAITGLKKTYPDARVTFVTSEYSSGLLKGRKDLEEVMLSDTLGRKALFLKSLMLAVSMRRRRFTMAIVMNPDKFLHLACFLAGIPERIGYGRKWGSLLTRTLDDTRDKGEKHEVEYAKDLLELAGVKRDDAELVLPVAGSSKKKIKKYFENERVKGDKPLVVVHPGSSNPAKMWPKERYAALIRKIKEIKGCDIIVMGSASESGLVKEIVGMAGVDAVDSAGRFSVEDLVALLDEADIFIGNDTGPMHVAAVLGVPVVAVFGRNIAGVAPKRWGPLGEKNIVFHMADECGECSDTQCPFEYRCLKNISVDDVLEAVKTKM